MSLPKPKNYFVPNHTVDMSKIRRVIELVAECYGVEVNDIHERTRIQPIVEARQMTMALIRDVEPSATLNWIASLFAVDHGTVMHACEVIRNRRAVYPAMDANCRKILELVATNN